MYRVGLGAEQSGAGAKAVSFALLFPEGSFRFPTTVDSGRGRDVTNTNQQRKGVFEVVALWLQRFAGETVPDEN